MHKNSTWAIPSRYTPATCAKYCHETGSHCNHHGNSGNCWILFAKLSSRNIWITTQSSKGTWQHIWRTYEQWTWTSYCTAEADVEADQWSCRADTPSSSEHCWKRCQSWVEETIGEYEFAKVPQVSLSQMDRCVMAVRHGGWQLCWKRLTWRWINYYISVGRWVPDIWNQYLWRCRHYATLRGWGTCLARDYV